MLPFVRETLEAGSLGDVLAWSIPPDACPRMAIGSLEFDSGTGYTGSHMVNEHLHHIDISDAPALVELAEDVRSSNRPTVLQRGDEELVVVIPCRPRSAPHVPKLADPDDIWAGYDPERVRQGLAESAGALRDLERGAFLADLKEQGQQDSSGRPLDA